MQSKTCPCGSNKSFEKCCGRFLDGDQHAKTPEQLMRSRYTAYALGGYGEYLLQTWFPATSAGVDATSLSIRSLDWCGLEILDKSQQGDNGMVEFKAYYHPAKADDDGVMHEKSTFVRTNGRWFYVGGEVS